VYESRVELASSAFSSARADAERKKRWRGNWGVVPNIMRRSFLAFNCWSRDHHHKEAINCVHFSLTPAANQNSFKCRRGEKSNSSRNHFNLIFMRLEIWFKRRTSKFHNDIMIFNDTLPIILLYISNRSSHNYDEAPESKINYTNISHPLNFLSSFCSAQRWERIRFFLKHC
jgi:hypothetical protein